MWHRLFIVLLFLSLFAPLAQAAPTTPTTDFTDNGDGTVLHKKTGLTWMRCAIGATWTGTTCSGGAHTFLWADAATMTRTFAGQNDWRLPNIVELNSIVEREAVSPVINSAIFPGTVTAYFWSASAYAGDSNRAWLVDFYFGKNYADYKTLNYYVRLVRGGQALDASGAYTPTADFTDNEDGTVTHRKTGLMWKQCAEGYSYVSQRCLGTAGAYTWQQAAILGSSLAGHNDWRLPTVGELQSIVEYRNVNPAVNIAVFTDAQQQYWSAIPFYSNEDMAWTVSFAASGIASVSDIVHPRAVRLVRNVDPAAAPPRLVWPGPSAPVMQAASTPTFSVDSGLLTIPAVTDGSNIYTVGLRLLPGGGTPTFTLDSAVASAGNSGASVNFDASTGDVTMPGVVVSGAGISATMYDASLRLKPGVVPPAFELVGGNPSYGPPGGFSQVVSYLKAPAGYEKNSYGENVSLVLDGNDEPMIAFLAQRTSDKIHELFFTRWNRATRAFDTPLKIADLGVNAAQYGHDVSLARDSSTGAIGIAYLHPSTNDKIYYVASRNGGKTWSTPERVDVPTGAEEENEPCLVMRDGVVHLAYWHGNYKTISGSAYDKIIYRSKTDDQEWSMVEQPDAMTGEAKRSGLLSLAVDADGKPGVTFFLKQLSVVNYNDDVIYWRPAAGTLVKVTDTNGRQNDDPGVMLAYHGNKPRIAANMSRGEGGSSDHTRFYLLTSDDGAAWSAPQAVLDAKVTSASLGFFESMSIDSQGGARVMGGINASVGGEPLVYRSTDLANWKDISPDVHRKLGYNSRYLTHTLTRSGKIYAAFHDYDPDGPTGMAPGVILWREP